jgi:radical SAM superfamily enzyme YgiQ (UPF0313 family)
MKVLLINPPIRVHDMPRNFPLGLGYIASILLKEGHKVDVLDINAERLSKEKVIGRIGDYDIFGIGGLVTTYNYVSWLIPEIKKMYGGKIIIGGGLSVINDLMFKIGADIIVNKEGELTIVDVLNNLDNLNSVEGIHYRDKNNKIVKNEERELIQNLDEIPFPAWHLFPIENYIRTPILSSGTLRKMNILFGRGCPYNCKFCWHNFGRTTRLRSVNNVIEEIKTLIKKYKIEYFAFTDETFTVNKERVLEFCEKVRELKIKWGCSSRVNLIFEDMVRSMKKSGCNHIEFGIESGSQCMLNNMNKGTTTEQGIRAIKITQKAGIRTHATFIIGTPGETPESIWETVKFCNEAKLKHRVELFFMTAFPETELWNYAIKKGVIKNEEEFIRKLGDVKDFTMNLTDIDDKKLIELKNEAEKKCQPSLIDWIIDYYKNFGLKNLLKTSMNRTFKMVNKIKVKK